MSLIMVKNSAIWLRFSLFFLLFLPVLVQGKEQENTLPHGDFSELKNMGLSKVTQVIDPQTLQLNDGSLIRLVGLNYPDLKVYEVGDLALTAQKILEDMFVGQSVFVYQTKQKDWGRINRMGHGLAHIERQFDKAWAQGTLLSLGLVQVETGKRNPEMAAQMYALEKSARKEKMGIWDMDEFKIISPEQTPEHLKSYRIVEGRVESVASKNNRIYINFGKDWRKDFTISIKSGDKREFSKLGINPMDWGKKTIRVRGWIDEYNGPYIQITHPQAVEVLSP